MKKAIAIVVVAMVPVVNPQLTAGLDSADVEN